MLYVLYLCVVLVWKQSLEKTFLEIIVRLTLVLENNSQYEISASLSCRKSIKNIFSRRFYMKEEPDY